MNMEARCPATVPGGRCILQTGHGGPHQNKEINLNDLAIVGELREVAEADLVVLYAPGEGSAWLYKNRTGKASQPAQEGLDLRGTVALLIDLMEGTVQVRPTRNPGR